MAIVDGLLPEFDHEVATTRKLLERVPADRGDWRPHPKSSTLAGLATHVATLPRWGGMTLQTSEFDLATGESPALLATRDALVDEFDRQTSTMRAALVGRTDAELLAPWTLKRAGQTILTMPKIGVIRSFVLNHLVHHRGQLSVYLRQLDVPIPSIYGPSADEAPF
jgi:uncharacterized damage-inducible protein DinB